MAETISRDEIINRIKTNDIILVEALPQKYYEEGHLPLSIQMNYTEVEEKCETLLPQKDAFIVTYCASDTCPNSSYLADALIAKGYLNVKKYIGGKKDWVDANQKLEIK